MAQITRSTKIAGGTTLAANTVARATDVETDMLVLFNAHNNHDTGTSTWTTLQATGSSIVPLIINNSTGVQNIANFQDNGSNVLTIADGGTVTLTGTAVIPTATITTLGHTIAGYRRPNLTYVSATQVDVENNTGTLNQTTILFSDGSVRSVTEDTASANKYRRFDITAAAEFTSGTEDSGVRSGITEATNTWYAIYAVKSAIDSTKFVLAGDTTLPLQTNYSTLNTRYGGANSWIYLGLIRNGDNSAVTGDILAFQQSGHITLFTNSATGQSTTLAGNRLANTASATTLTYTYSAGTGATNVPANIGHARYGVETTTGSVKGVQIQNAAGTVYFDARWSSGLTVSSFWAHAGDGVKLSNSAAENEASALMFGGFTDNVLGVGPNPVL